MVKIIAYQLSESLLQNTKQKREIDKSNTIVPIPHATEGTSMTHFFIVGRMTI